MTTSDPPRQIDRDTFYMGLMLALRALRDDFVAEGTGFHEAFLSAVNFAREQGEFEIENARRIRLDPVFGVVHEANEMVLEAEQARLVALLNPRLKKAQFKISKTQADRELEETGAAEWFRAIAAHLNEQLSTSD
jgi:hypothetical protein